VSSLDDFSECDVIVIGHPLKEGARLDTWLETGKQVLDLVGKENWFRPSELQRPVLVTRMLVSYPQHDQDTPAHTSFKKLCEKEPDSI